MGIYPLVNIQKAIENGYFFWIFPLKMVIGIWLWINTHENTMVIPFITGLYPLVMSNIAIENGYRNSGFSH